MDETLPAMFAHALGVERFGPEEDFFRRGGQSVAATVLIARVNAAFGSDLRISDLFEEPTPHRLARRLEAGASAAAAESRPVTRTPQSAVGRPSREYGRVVNVWRYRGPVDELAFQDALQDLVARHEILGAGHAVRATVRYLALPARGGYREFFAQQLAAAATTEPFGPDGARLRVGLVRFEKKGGIIIIAADASVADPWSGQLLMRDLAALYAVRRTREGTAQLPPVGARVPERSVDPEEIEYWRSRLAGARLFSFAPEQPEAVDPNRSPYGAYHFEVAEETVRGIRRAAAETRSTPYMVLLTAFCLLALERGGGSDLTVTSHSTGRSDPRHLDSVGPFANRLAIRTDLSGASTFRDALARVRAACLDAFDHEVPFDAVGEALPELFDVGELVVPGFELIQSPLLGQVGQAADLSFAEEHAAPIPDDDGPELDGGMRWLLALTGARVDGDGNDGGGGGGVGTVQYPRSRFSVEAVAGLVESFQRILDKSVSE
jgi:hypothetical protein